MRLDVVGTVFRKELREMLRDRRSLAVMFGIPLVLYPLVAIGVATLAGSKKKELSGQEVRVYIPDGKRSVPKLIGLMNDQYTGLQAVELNPGIDAEASLRSGDLHAIVEAPPYAEARMVAGDEVELKVRVDRSRSPTPFAERKLNDMLDDYKKWIVEQRLALHGVPPDVLKSFKAQTEDISSGQQRFGKLLAGALPLMLLMTGMLGALFPALNATTTERELGTLETLLVTPAGRTELLVAKGALVLVCGLLTAALNMISMALVLKRATSLLDTAAREFSVSFGSLSLTYLAAVPTLVLFSTVVLIVGLVARNFREANAFATPVMLLPLASLAVGIMEPHATPAILVTPIANTSVIIREVLTGRVSAGDYFLAFAASAVYAALMLSVAARLFSNEQLVNPAWEPLSLRGFRRGGSAAGTLAARPRRLPAPDEALALFALALLLMFYVTPSFRHGGLLVVIIVNQLVLFLAPTLLFARFGRWRWDQTFQLRRLDAAPLAGAAMIGIGLVPWAQLFSAMQQWAWPRDLDDSARAVAELVLDSLTKYPVLTIVLTGALAGTCEELLFRGPIQTAFVRRLPPAAAIGITAVLFGAAHMDLHGLPLRTLLGVLLGWVVWRWRSIFPAMLIHGFYDGTALAYAWWIIHRHGPGAAMETETAFRFDAATSAQLAGGAVLLAAGFMLLRRARPEAFPAESPLPAAPVGATPASPDP